MLFRKSINEDIESIIEIIMEAQNNFKIEGIDQWQNGYPNKDTIKEDILNGASYVITENNKVVGTFVISFDGEETYDEIYNGNWISNEKFCVIHRIAIDKNYKRSGIASEILKYVEKLSLKDGVHSIKIDTHEDNIPMQKLLKKNDFSYCGIIYLGDSSKRIAFEKTF